MKIGTLYLVSFLVFLTSCTKQVKDINLPQIESKLVVVCFLSPQDSVVSLSLTKTNPANSIHSSNIVVTDANVVISGENQTAELIYNSKRKFYQIDTSHIKINYGEKYTLIINTPDNNVLRSECTVPAQRIKFISCELYPTNIEEVDYSIKVSNTNDSPVYSSILIGYNLKTPLPHDTLFVSVYNDLRLFETNFNDSTIYGHFTMTDMLPFFISELYFDKPFGLRVLVCDKNYYMYHRDIETYSSVTPYLLQPIYYHTNIEGGLGIFASYSYQ